MQLGKIALDIPDDWLDRSMYTFVAPVENVSPDLRAKPTQFRKNVVIQRRDLQDEEGMDACVEYLRSSTVSTFGDIPIEIVDGPQTEQFQSRRLTYTVIDDVSQQPVAQVIYLCLRPESVGAGGGAEWQVAFSLPALNLKREIPDLDRMVASLKLDDDA